MFGELVEALVRLTLSHLIQPTHELAETLASLERITDLVLRSVPATPAEPRRRQVAAAVGSGPFQGNGAMSASTRLRLRRFRWSM